MNMRIKKHKTKIKERMENYIFLVKNPKFALAQLIYALYSHDHDKIPYPLLIFVLRYLGGWPGVSLYIPIREYRFKLKLGKFKKIIEFVILPLLFIAFIIFGASQKSETFIFGFVQNLMADIVLILLIIYILPKILNKPKKHDLNLYLKRSLFNEVDEEVVYNLSIVNVGQEVYETKGLYWEIFIPASLVKQDKIEKNNSNLEKNDFFHFDMWKIYGENSSPLFLSQEITICKIKVSSTDLLKYEFGEPKIYFQIYSINGNIPNYENITNDFEGYGIEFAKYPKLGEKVFEGWK